MTRLLAPEMFGVMSLAYVFLTGLALFSDIGIGQSIVQSRRGGDATFLNTAWTMKILRGALIAFVMLQVSVALHYAVVVGWISAGTVYADGSLPYVLAAFSLTALISGFDSTKMSVAQRNLDLRSVVKIDIASSLASLVSMVLWALVDRSIWALVAGGVIGALTRAVLSHWILSGHSNRLAWEAEARGEILHFGLWIFFSSMLGVLVMNGDRLLLAGLLSPDVLGLYAIAFMLVNSLQEVSNKLIFGVAFPALSEVVRENPHRLKETYYKFRIPLDAVSLFVAGSVFVLGTPIVSFLYDQRYAKAGPVLEVLSLSLVMSRYYLTEQCCLALGQSKFITLFNAIRMAALYFLVPTAFLFFQLPGAVWAIVLSTLSVLPAVAYVKIKLGLLDVRRELMTLPIFLIGIILAKLLTLIFFGRWSY